MATDDEALLYALGDCVLALMEATVAVDAITNISDALARVDADPADVLPRQGRDPPAAACCTRSGRTVEVSAPPSSSPSARPPRWNVPDALELSIVRGDPLPVADWPDWQREPTGVEAS